MKLILTCCALFAVCFYAHVALGATAIVIDTAEVHKSAKEIVDTLKAGTKVATGRVDGAWVEVRYTKEGETQARDGWVQGAYLDPIEEGYDATVSAHCIVHVQNPRDVGQLDVATIEEHYDTVVASLANAQNEPPFKPNAKVRIYLLAKATYAALAKSANEPDDSVAFSPNVGTVYLDFSLRDTTTSMNGQIVHEMARLVLMDYSMQPQGRQGAGQPLPLWLVEAFAAYHELRAGFDTDNLLYVPDKPKLTMLVRDQSLPRHFEDRRAYLATSGTLGHMLFNHGTKEQFSQLVRLVQTTGARTKGDALLLQFYGMTRAAFEKEWSDYVDLLKEKYKIRRLEKEIEEKDRDGDFGGPDITHNGPPGGGFAARNG